MIRNALRLSVVIAVLLSPAAMLPSQAKAKQPPPPESGNVSIAGEIVDCSEYMLLGFKGGDRRFIQARNIDMGAPACLIADATHEIYLLVAPMGQAKEKFQPTQNYLGGGTTVKGTVYQQASLKVLTIETVLRSTAPPHTRLNPSKEPLPVGTLNPPVKP